MNARTLQTRLQGPKTGQERYQQRRTQRQNPLHWRPEAMLSTKSKSLLHEDPANERYPNHNELVV